MYADTAPLAVMVDWLRTLVRRQVLVINNGKGGVGKSSLAATLAVLLALIGKKVLLVEMDPQGNNAEDLGFILHEGIYDNGRSQAEAIIGGSKLQPTGEARPNLWVVPGGEELEAVIEELYCQRRAAASNGDTNWLYMYAAAIADVADSYDYVILDVAPGSLVLQAQAMTAGDMVLVPCRSDSSSQKGLRQVARRFGEALPHNPNLRLLGVVPFGVDSRSTRLKTEMREYLGRDLGETAPVFETAIRYFERAAAACRDAGLVPHELVKTGGLDAGVLASTRKLANDYRSLNIEVMAQIAVLIKKDEDSEAGQDPQ